MALPEHFIRLGPVAKELTADQINPQALRREVEPWLSAVFQSEHLSLLVGNGLSTAIAGIAGVPPVGMGTVTFDRADEELVKSAAAAAADAAGRTENLEDQIRAALQLVAGLDVLGEKDRAGEWRAAIARVLQDLVSSLVSMERGVAAQLDSRSDEGLEASSVLVSFLLSFAGRAASRDRLNVFTTNYDRVIEFGCDLAGVRTIDRFVGALEPRFRASRLEVDVHYNPPGTRGEPRFLEGVIRLTKLHGSIDWVSDRSGIRREAVPFGATDVAIPDPYQSLMIFPNPAKDRETLEYPYAELFRDFASALCRPNSSLVTYGYGFGDDHINRVIADMLSIPSTHLVIVAFGDAGNRIQRFLSKSGREQQISLLIGNQFGDLRNLVRYYLPKPGVEAVELRRADLLRKREAPVLNAAAGDSSDE